MYVKFRCVFRQLSPSLLASGVRYEMKQGKTKCVFTSEWRLMKVITCLFFKKHSQRSAASHAYTHAHTHTHTYTHTHTHTHAHTRTHTRMHARTHARTHAHTHTCTHAHTHTHAHMHAHTCTHARTHAHTHTRTHTHSVWLFYMIQMQRWQLKTRAVNFSLKNTLHGCDE